MALQALKDLEHEVVTFAEQVGAPGLRLLGPRQFHGIEINPFARELASMVVWIGYLQWNRANGYSSLQEPILEPLENIVLHDALMNEDGTEYEWPTATFIAGNPPFVGSYRLRRELGDEYVDRLRQAFAGRLPNGVDLVCYWFEKARAACERRPDTRVGLIATSSIRNGSNRRVVEQINDTSGMFMAWSDEPWILEGANVQVSIVGFGGRYDGEDPHLNGRPVASINSDLTGGANVADALVLQENRGLCFKGIDLSGPFTINGEIARAWLTSPNPTGVSNANVLRPYVNGSDINKTSRDAWVIDFNQLPFEVAQEYVVPFQYVVDHVKPVRMGKRDEGAKRYWWLHHRPRPEMRAALRPLSRYIATTRHSKHRYFQWLPADTLTDSAIVVIATESDLVFGIVSSRIHVAWALATGSTLENRPRYTSTTCFETFPFPRPSDEQRGEVEKWARHMDNVRGQLLTADPKLTMTELYNELANLRDSRDSTARAYPLLLAHERLDEAVAAAYGWEWPLSDEEILERLLELNLRRAAEEQRVEATADDRAEAAAD